MEGQSSIWSSEGDQDRGCRGERSCWCRGTSRDWSQLVWPTYNTSPTSRRRIHPGLVRLIRHTGQTIHWGFNIDRSRGSSIFSGLFKGPITRRWWRRDARLWAITGTGGYGCYCNLSIFHGLFSCRWWRGFRDEFWPTWRCIPEAEGLRKPLEAIVHPGGISTALLSHRCSSMEER
jgi:hypothetical protein